ncbi:NAD(P)H-dependent oxidoreductase [Sphingomonas sp. JC676]|uniref:FMN-dependent NADH-azoreductase n=1 Tax=Sphingomonas sp. JC676 TaxID=2768065 RepID=UPI001657DFC2|nr:NAD(P)H-dependent oxidoreductase [Sphingomonas sp. JC676]MBC9035098.1 NAD(P)H-dependent oxidoreductase [Sphingomonas sp. JC676]
MNILHVSCSPLGQAAESHRLSQRIVGFLLAREPGATVTNRVIGDGTIPHVDENYAIAQQSTADPSQEGSIALSEELIQEVERADFVVIGTPVHNFTVPSALKAWIDLVVRARRTFDVTKDGKIGRLRDRPVYVAVASGGRYSGERARQPDFLTPYLKAVLGVVGLRDLTFFSVQGTASGPDAVAEAKASADQAVQDHFHSMCFTDRLRPVFAIAVLSN